MYANTVAFAFTLEPTNNQNMRRTLFATLAFAVGAIVGWPFALAVAIPFVFEELFLFSGDTVSPSSRVSWMLQRWGRLTVCGLAAALLLVCLQASRLLMLAHTGYLGSRSRPGHAVLRQAHHRAMEHHQVQRLPRSTTRSWPLRDRTFRVLHSQPSVEPQRYRALCLDITSSPTCHPPDRIQTSRRTRRTGTQFSIHAYGHTACSDVCLVRHHVLPGPQRGTFHVSGVPLDLL